MLFIDSNYLIKFDKKRNSHFVDKNVPTNAKIDSEFLNLLSKPSKLARHI